MTTYRQFVYSILEQLNKNTDDAKINELHVLYWTRMVVNKAIYDIAKSGGSLDRFMVQTSVDLLLKENGKKYFTLPADVFNLYDNKGIDSISYNEDEECDISVLFSRTTLGKSRSLYLDEYTEPSISNPYFYVIGNTVNILGLECSDISSLSVVLVSPIDTNSICSLDETINLPEEKLLLAYYAVMDLCKFKILTASDLLNNGSDVEVSKNDYAIAYQKGQQQVPQQEQQE